MSRSEIRGPRAEGPPPRCSLECLENRADDRTSELGGHAVERVDVLSEKRGWIERAGARRDVEFLTILHARIAPEDLVGLEVLELHRGGQREHVAGRLLLLVECRRLNRDRRDGAREHRVHAGGVGLDGVLAAPDELAANAFGDAALHVEDRGLVGELRYADPMNVGRQERPATGQRIAASALREHCRNNNQWLEHHDTTMLTRRPFATTTFLTVRPSRCGRM